MTCFIHDGNTNMMLLAAKYDKDILSHIEPFVYEWTAARKGSISAEHGLGQMKPECIGSAQTLVNTVLPHCYVVLPTCLPNHNCL